MTRKSSPKRFIAGSPIISVLTLAILLASWSAIGFAQNIYDAGWGADYSHCAGAQQPLRYRVGNYEGENILVSGVITCRDDGDAYIYSVDYMNFSLSSYSAWKNAHIDWFGAGAQRDGGNGRNEWIYDEARPVRVLIAGSGKRVSITNLSFRVPKTTLARARGFSFYVVGGGIFWTVRMLGPDNSPPGSDSSAKPAIIALPSDNAASKQVPPASQASVVVGRPDWGTRMTTCEGEQGLLPLKAAAPDNDNLLANGIITCTDAGDAFVYAIEYMNFSLAAKSKWTSAHLEWFGAGVQRAGPAGKNDWIYDEVRPVQVDIKPDTKRVAVTNISFRIPKTVIAQARGFGFYVVGGGIMWSILLL